MALIEIKYSYNTKPSVTVQDVVKWDDHYGLNNRSAYRFAAIQDSDIILGQQAYDYLVSAGILERIPDFILPHKYLQQGEEGWSLYRSVPNPNCSAELELFNQQKADFFNLLHTELKAVCKVTFPPVVDSGTNIKWFKRLTRYHWQEIPVVVGQYKGHNLWVIIEDEDTTAYDFAMQTAPSMNNDKDAILKMLLGLNF